MESTTIERTPDGGYVARGTAFWEIIAQHRFTIDGVDGSWVFVQWAPDSEMVEIGCQHRYELFGLDASGDASQVAWTSYGCDV